MQRKACDVVKEIIEKYEEHFEMMDIQEFKDGLIEILAHLLIKEQEYNEYLKKLVSHYENNRN